MMTSNDSNASMSNDTSPVPNDTSTVSVSVAAVYPATMTGAAAPVAIVGLGRLRRECGHGQRRNDNS